MANLDALAPIAVGFAGGAVVAFFLKTFGEWLTRPVIVATFVQDAGCYVETMIGNPPRNKGKYLRLRISNGGKSSIRGCQGFTTRIHKRQSGKIVSDSREVLEMSWAHYGSRPRDLPVGAFFYMDMAFVDCQPNNNNVLGLGVEWLPHNTAISLLDGTAASFELEVLIAADNAAPLSRKVAFDYDPRIDDLRFSWD